jgi:hypothetical protein
MPHGLDPILKEKFIPDAGMHLQDFCPTCHVPRTTFSPPHAKVFVTDLPRMIRLNRHQFMLRGQYVDAFVGQCFCGQVVIVKLIEA